MKRLFQMVVASILLGSLTIQADPILTWFWDDPVEYENDQPIPGGDLTGRTLYCGMEDGGPYPASKLFEMQAPPSLEDMAFVVGGLPGDYYCVMTVSSVNHLSESGFSNQVNFTVTPGSLGFVPKPPVLSLQ